MTSVKASLIVLASTAAIAAVLQTPTEPPRFRVGVDAVAIDAVVTDRKGQTVSDLTAADFEVFQDGKRQKVTFAQFVPVTTSTASAERPVASGLRPPPAPVVGTAPAPIARAQVRRTILVVVDDLGLSVAGMDNIRRGLRGFVDTGLLPTDLVAIVRTGESRGVLQSLTTDRAVLHAAIDALQYNVLSRKGVWPYGDITQLGGAAPSADDGSGPQASLKAVDSLAALGLIVQAARDLPGRKTVVLASEGFPLTVDLATGRSRGLDPRAPSAADRGNESSARELDPRVRPSIDRVIDQATRSGVVIYAIDGQALQAAGLNAADDIHWADADLNSGGEMGTLVRRLAMERRVTSREGQESLAYLAEQTGGFAVMNTNDLAGGLGRISTDVRDYYVIGYEPDRETFAAPGKSPRLHRIAVNVRRPGLRVKARKEFIGVSDPERPTGPFTPAQQLVRAAFSPFSETSIALRATNLPGYTPGRGLFVRSVLHVDAQALAFSTDADGTKKASADLVCLIFNSDGARVDTVTTGFDITLEPVAAEQAIEEGLVYTARVPIAKPGGYQLRCAVRDRHSGAIGTVGGFVSVPDVPGETLALSGLVLNAGERAAVASIDADRFSLRPADALRVYAPGTRLSYSYEIYNAEAAVQAVASLWRDTEKILSLPPDALSRPASGPFVGAGHLALADDLAAGTYVLQIAVTADDARTRKPRVAVQRLSFDIR